MEKIYKCFKNEKKVKFVLQYETTKSSFANTKDKYPLLSQSVSYCIDIGKTERTLWEMVEENVYKSNKKKEQGTIFEHLFTWEHFKHIFDLFNVDD